LLKYLKFTLAYYFFKFILSFNSSASSKVRSEISLFSRCLFNHLKEFNRHNLKLALVIFILIGWSLEIFYDLLATPYYIILDDLIQIFSCSFILFSTDPGTENTGDVVESRIGPSGPTFTIEDDDDDDDEYYSSDPTNSEDKKPDSDNSGSKDSGGSSEAGKSGSGSEKSGSDDSNKGSSGSGEGGSGENESDVSYPDYGGLSEQFDPDRQKQGGSGATSESGSGAGSSDSGPSESVISENLPDIGSYITDNPFLGFLEWLNQFFF
jgi:hypothetical protein